MADETTKICTKCLIERPLDDFHRTKNGRLGRQSRCRYCLNKTDIRWVTPEDIASPTKRCCVCKQTKPKSEFNKDKFNKDGLMPRCRVCYNASIDKDKRRAYLSEYQRAHRAELNVQTREWQKNNPEKFKQYMRRVKLRTKFGLTLEEYNDMLESQNGVCLLCGGVSENKALAVDHHHGSGKVRGLLCDLCNRGLGNCHEDTDVLRGLISYLQSLQEAVA